MKINIFLMNYSEFTFIFEKTGFLIKLSSTRTNKFKQVNVQHLLIVFCVLFVHAPNFND